MGGRFPYYPQSIYAGHRIHRYDGAANEISGGAAVDPIIYGIFGVEPHADGSIRIDPKPGTLGRGASLRNLVVRGRRIDLALKEDGYELSVDGRPAARIKYGQFFLLPGVRAPGNVPGTP